ncbi:MAG TPA: flagellar assembly peptidoglycan hydrolase FlgJ [Azoarcus sp.]|nr:flagellar assembly peptidoglycan hydrolase FlgJ [Azoarcus sp.]
MAGGPGAVLNSLDPRSLSDLQRLSRDGDSSEALRAAAQQFEALFLQMTLKAMRNASSGEGPFDSEQTRFLQGMYDQQLSSDLANGRGTGLSEAIYRQLGGQPEPAAAAAPGPDGRNWFDLTPARRAAIPAARRFNEAAEPAVVTPSQAPASRETQAPGHVTDFVARIGAHARDAARALGVSEHFVVAQAALESGWGRGELRRADGSPSYNLFNIKAGAGWSGAVVELPVTEYAGGRAYTEQARFRAYESYAEAFDDYVRLLSDNQRYAGVLGQTSASGFAFGLQQSGYATDPVYARKLMRVIDGVQRVASQAG